MHSKFSTCIKVVGGGLKVFTGKGFRVKKCFKNNGILFVYFRIELYLSVVKKKAASLVLFIIHDSNQVLRPREIASSIMSIEGTYVLDFTPTTSTVYLRLAYHATGQDGTTAASAGAGRAGSSPTGRGFSKIVLTGHIGIEEKITRWRLVKLVKNPNDYYRFGFNGQEKVNEIYGRATHYYAPNWTYDARIGRRWNLDPIPQVGISDYSAFNGNPIYFNDDDGDIVKVYVSNKAVGHTMINLYSAPEVKKGHKQVKVRVPVYQVTVTNESGKSKTFLYTRYNQRANVSKGGEVEDRTFDVNKDGDKFPAVVRPRWKTTVLELRNPTNVKDQKGVIGMRGDKSNEERVAIQFHPLGASDGCLLSVGQNNLLSGSAVNSSGNTSGQEHNAFMNTINDYQRDDQKNGHDAGIEVTFSRLHDNSDYKNDTQNKSSGSGNNSSGSNLPKSPPPLDNSLEGAPSQH